MDKIPFRTTQDTMVKKNIKFVGISVGDRIILGFLNGGAVQTQQVASCGRQTQRLRPVEPCRQIFRTLVRHAKCGEAMVLHGCGSNRYPKWDPGKWKHGPKPAVPSWFHFDLCPHVCLTHLAGTYVI